jgi:hypothetical protein
MQTEVIRFDDAHHLGEPATCPLLGWRSRLAALLLLAMPRGMTRRRVLPTGVSTPSSDGFICCFKFDDESRLQPVPDQMPVKLSNGWISNAVSSHCKAMKKQKRPISGALLLLGYGFTDGFAW